MAVKRTYPLGPTLIVLAAALWALDGIVRRSLFALPAVTVVFYETLIGTLIIAPFALPALRQQAKKITAQTMTVAVAVSLLSGLLGTVWFTTALFKVNYISFSVVFLLQKLQPIFAIAAARVLLKEKITKLYLVWAAIALVAAYFVTFANGFVDISAGPEPVTAALYALGAAFAWGTGTALSKLLLKDVSDTAATGLRFGLTSLVALPAVFLLGQGASLTAITVSQIGRLVFIAISTGMVALWIYYKGLAKTEAKISTLLELVFPVLAVFIDAVLYHTTLDLTQYLAASVLLYSVYQIGKLQK